MLEVGDDYIVELVLVGCNEKQIIGHLTRSNIIILLLVYYLIELAAKSLIAYKTKKLGNHPILKEL